MVKHYQRMDDHVVARQVKLSPNYFNPNNPEIEHQQLRCRWCGCKMFFIGYSNGGQTVDYACPNNWDPCPNNLDTKKEWEVTGKDIAFNPRYLTSFKIPFNPRYIA